VEVKRFARVAYSIIVSRDLCFHAYLTSCSAILLPLTIRVHPNILSISQAISQSTNTERGTKLGCHMLTLRPYQPLPSMATSNSFKSTHLWRNSPASVGSSFPLFSTYAKIAEEGDDKLAECWRKDADGILVSWAIALASIPHSCARQLEYLRLIYCQPRCAE